MNKKNYCNYHKKVMECEDCEQFEAFITDCKEVNNGWCCGYLCGTCTDHKEKKDKESKELKKDKLYLLEVECPCEREDGTFNYWNTLLVGYVVGTEEEFFYGSSFDRMDDGTFTGNDTWKLSAQQFNDWVKSIKEIA